MLVSFEKSVELYSCFQMVITAIVYLIMTIQQSEFAH